MAETHQPFSSLELCEALSGDFHASEPKGSLGAARAAWLRERRPHQPWLFSSWLLITWAARRIHAWLLYQHEGAGESAGGKCSLYVPSCPKSLGSHLLKTKPVPPAGKVRAIPAL